MKKLFVFVSGILGALVGIYIVRFAIPKLLNSIESISFVYCVIVSLLATTLSLRGKEKIYNSTEKTFETVYVSISTKLLAIFCGSLFGGIAILIIDQLVRGYSNVFFLAPIVSFIATIIMLRIKAFSVSDSKIGIFFKSKVWLILQILWGIIVIMTAKYDSSYPQRVWLFYSFIGNDFRTTGLIQALIVTLPFATSIYSWFKTK